MHIITETLKQFAQAALVYILLIFGYSQVSEAAFCGGWQLLYSASTSGGANTFAGNNFLLTNSNVEPSTCAAVVLTGDEYTNLIKNRIDTANINITTLQGNQTTLNNNIQTVSTALNQLITTVQTQQTALDDLTQKFNTQGLRDENNFLHINHDDSLTLFYAVLGLFVTAFVWRFARNSLNVADSSHVSE